MCIAQDEKEHDKYFFLCIFVDRLSERTFTHVIPCARQHDARRFRLDR